MVQRLELRFDDVAALKKEHESQLAHGGVFLKGVHGIEAFTPCELVLHHPDGGEPLIVGVTVVAAPPEQEREGGVRLLLDRGLESVLTAFVSRDAPAEREGDHAEPRAARSGALPPQRRLNQLPIPDQIKLAKTSTSLSERTALERTHGKAVWEQLLRNRHLTVPEVARIARKGTVPRPYLEIIVANATWARAASVRRALLSNPKLTNESITKALRLAPKHELKLMLKQTAYPIAVRTLAQRLLGR